MIFRAGLAIAILLSASPAFGQATLPAGTVEQTENARLNAMSAGDFDTVATLLADDFITTTSDGATADRAEYLDRLRSGRRLPTGVTHEDVRIRLYGDAAVITGRSRATLVSDGTERKVVVRYTHVYVRQAGRWKMVAMHVGPG